MAIIKQMDEILANKIAAGEVVEKCSSVVKELVENSIDAGSSEIKIDLIESGTKEIKVIDNGKGMDRIDAVNAFNRHATSKIIDEDDLYHIDTLGFRGEALASIASVSKIELTTSTGDIGTIVNINGGKVLSVENGDARRGTKITVSELFYNTPARLKYMKSIYAELASITEYVSRIALSFPNIRFTLTNNSNILLKTDGSNNLLKTINDIYGKDIVKQMLDINGENDDFKITGYISKPEVHRSNRNHMIILVNNRVIKNNNINKCINDAYMGYKPDTRYPVVVINIILDPYLVDVNIHPTKMDVKFSKEDSLLDLITKTIRDRLKPITLIPKIDLDKVDNDKLDSTLLDKVDINKLNNTILDTEEYIVNDFKIEEPTVKYEETKLEFKKEEQKFPSLEYVGIVHGTYIICQNEIGMYLIDQHAAIERINYELYKHKLTEPTNKSTTLLIPYTLEYTTSEFIVLKENISILKNMGFNIEQFGISSIVIKSIPNWLPKDYELESIKKIIDILLVEEKRFDIAKFNNLVASTLACKMSVKANTYLTKQDVDYILNGLSNCENPFNCPHGRPTIITYTKQELEKQFKRTGF